MSPDTRPHSHLVSHSISEQRSRISVELRGFEPLTPSMRTRCATGLRYSPENLSQPSKPGGLPAPRITAPRSRSPVACGTTAMSHHRAPDHYDVTSPWSRPPP